MAALTPDPMSIAQAIASFIAAQGVRRVYGLCGGHIQPIWDALSQFGVTIIDTRHEGAAVHMAHAEAELTGGLGVALVTAGPGFTNTLTGLANARVASSSVLVISGRPPRPQEGLGALQEIPQGSLARPLCRRTEQVTHQGRVLPALAGAVWSALGGDGPPGPAYVDFPTDLLREPVIDRQQARKWMVRRGPAPLRPDPGPVAAAAKVLTGSRRLVVVAGRTQRLESSLLVRFLDETDAIFIAQPEARSLLECAPTRSVLGAKGRALAEADVVLTLGCQLNFQLAYGSPAVIGGAARLIRVGPSQNDLLDNRPADVEVQGDVSAVLAALLALGVRPRDPDSGWRAYLRSVSANRVAKLRSEIESAPAGSDARMHPYRLLEALQEFIGPDCIVVADGGDILSFARVALSPTRYLDAGAFGCLGVGVPFAIAAALSDRARPVICVTGDGAFGFHAMELDTAARTAAPVLIVVANNEAWNIERNDQRAHWNGNILGSELPGCRYDLLATALGIHGARVDDPANLREALQVALNHLPALVDVAVTRDAESPDFRAGLPGVPDHQALATWDEVDRRMAEQCASPQA